MKKIFLSLSLALAAIFGGQQAQAQFKLGKALDGAKKGVQALTLTDEQMAAYVKESVDWMDKHNPVPGEDDPYTQRLRRLTEGLTEVDGIPLNFKVYDVIDGLRLPRRQRQGLLLADGYNERRRAAGNHRP